MTELSVAGFSVSAGERSHTVQFYGEDGVLLHELNSYIGSALANGSSAVIIATQAHIDGLGRTLSARGVNVEEATAEGRYVPLPATEVLEKFMLDGQPDPVRFSEAIAPLIRRAAEASRSEDRRVVAFGEMVALLWAEGKKDAAIEVERLWNQLAKNYSFSLHRAYSVHAFGQEERVNSLLRICAEHPDFAGDSLQTDTLAQERNLLSKGQEPFRLFVENVLDYAIFMLDVEGRVVTWNPGAERIKGYKASEIVGRHFSKFYSEEDVRREKPQQLLRRAAEDGHVEDEGWRVRKNGSKFWARVTITAVKDEYGKLMGFGKVTRDLTDQKHAELALQRSEERARLFIEAVQDYAIFMLDPEGCVSTWNTGAERIKGYKASEIIGQHFSIFYPKEDISATKPWRELDIAMREGRYEDEGWRVRKDGSRFWANVIITPVIDHEGTLIGFTKVTRDFTQRMLAQTALEDSQRKLHESEKSLRDLSLHLLRTQDEERRRIGREIHDSLGQYLSVLKMRLESYTGDAKEIAECTKLTDECLKEVRTISYLLYPPMLEEIGLRSAIPWYLDGFSARSGIKTSFQIPDDLGRLDRDSELVLFRVLQESLTNVQRHSGSPTAEIIISCADDLVSLAVIDQGKGMPAALLEQGSQDWLGSLGVGLRGMSERLRQLGGALDVSSSDKRTVVRATVPLKKPQSMTTPRLR